MEQPVASTSKEILPPESESRKKQSAKAFAAAKKRQKREKELEDELANLGEGGALKGRYVNRTPGAFVYCAECGTSKYYVMSL